MVYPLLSLVLTSTPENFVDMANNIDMYAVTVLLNFNNSFCFTERNEVIGTSSLYQQGAKLALLTSRGN